MIIDVPKISPDGTPYQGELPGEVLDLAGDKFAQAAGPVRYDLFVYVVTHEVIVKGTVEAPIRLLCGRCGDFFSTKLIVSSFLRAYPVTDGMEKLDISGDIREDIVLEIPTYPRCGWEGSGVCPHSGVNLADLKVQEPAPVDNPWGALDMLKKKSGRS